MSVLVFELIMREAGGGFIGKINATQKLIVEDFPEQKEWIGKMFSVINDFFQKVQTEVNGSLEFNSNIMGVEHTFDFFYVSHAASLPLIVKWTKSKRPSSVVVAAAYLGNWSGDWDDSPTAMYVISNKVLVPFICQVAWEFTQDGNISITDFATMRGSETALRVPVSGQRVKIVVRISP